MSDRTFQNKSFDNYLHKKSLLVLSKCKKFLCMLLQQCYRLLGEDVFFVVKHQFDDFVMGDVEGSHVNDIYMPELVYSKRTSCKKAKAVFTDFAVLGDIFITSVHFPDLKLIGERLSFCLISSSDSNNLKKSLQ